jgi:hypothetical protein
MPVECIQHTVPTAAGEYRESFIRQRRGGNPISSGAETRCLCSQGRRRLRCCTAEAAARVDELGRSCGGALCCAYVASVMWSVWHAIVVPQRPAANTTDGAAAETAACCSSTNLVFPEAMLPTACGCARTSVCTELACSAATCASNGIYIYIYQRGCRCRWPCPAYAAAHRCALPAALKIERG